MSNSIRGSKILPMSFRLITLFWLVAQTIVMASDRPVVLVSIAVYQPLVQQMVGETIEVQTLVPVEANFHAFDPSPKRMNQLLSAKAWFIIGEPFEKKVREACSYSRTPPIIVDLRENLPLITSDDGGDGADPHIWTSPQLMKIQLKTIQNSLLSIFPDIQDIINANEEILQSRCDALISLADECLREHTGKVIIIAHGAYGYLCRDYGIEQLSIETGGKEATVGSLQTLLTRAKNHHVQTVFSLSQHPQQGIERVATILNAKIVLLDPFQAGYFEEEERVIKSFQSALKEES